MKNLLELNWGVSVVSIELEINSNSSYAFCRILINTMIMVILRNEGLT